MTNKPTHDGIKETHEHRHPVTASHHSELNRRREMKTQIEKKTPSINHLFGGG
jgi:hypothetical protein